MLPFIETTALLKYILVKERTANELNGSLDTPELMAPSHPAGLLRRPATTAVAGKPAATREKATSWPT